MSAQAPDGPLAGITILDLTNVLAGPFACHQLAHLGATVTKVEMPEGGDLARQLGQDEALSARGMGISFLAPNAGKRSLTLNLKTAEGRAVLLRLVRKADVLVENFRPGVMDRLGVGADVLRAANPALIYCAISGFGQSGPLADRPAYDQIVQGMSGAMAITGDAACAPQRAGWPVSDTVGGLTAAMAISAALNQRPRGCVIDVSMLDSLLATMGWAVSNWLVGGVRPVPAGNENLTSAPSAAYACADGPLNIAANKQDQWEALARHLGLATLIDDPRFVTRADRKANRSALNAALGAVLATRPAETWETELNAIGVPAGRILSVEAALDHPQVKGRDQIATYALEDGREIRAFRTGLHIDGAAPRVTAPPPELGADTDAILREAGYTPEDIADLRRSGAI
ncbi:CaiB/BaiF CoA transferase family protein [Jannaschia pohangensis]|uniref:Crotonobetainyl-CoA:carnitine CoA-transferase CaiB n=1 Tax=Jannaschia pohangensis TaxID=390807 RepID=A0A1I3J510_9RHOB|nr:CoA transferase [Jannaschia pohangensis]SFI55293.1 Crotonobetainyl-CoA:carnitine CoA-transferase CaiB [Jannaschia pohangensis]